MEEEIYDNKLPDAEAKVIKVNDHLIRCVHP